MTRVIKVGGRPQSDPRLAAIVASCWNRDAGSVVLVHGGGDEGRTLQSALGGSTTFVERAARHDGEGHRSRSHGALGEREQAARRQRSSQSGIDAVGLSGEDAALIAAAPMDAAAPRATSAFRER